MERVKESSAKAVALHFLLRNHGNPFLSRRTLFPTQDHRHRTDHRANAQTGRRKSTWCPGCTLCMCSNRPRQVRAAKAVGKVLAKAREARAGVEAKVRGMDWEMRRAGSRAGVASGVERAEVKVVLRAESKAKAVAVVKDRQKAAGKAVVRVVAKVVAKAVPKAEVLVGFLHSSARTHHRS